MIKPNKTPPLIPLLLLLLLLLLLPPQTRCIFRQPTMLTFLGSGEGKREGEGPVERACR